MRNSITMLCGILLAVSTGCSTAKYDTGKPTLRDYSGSANSHQQYVGWDMKYSLDNPSAYHFSDQQALTESKSRLTATNLTQSSINTDELYDDSNDD